ncbi:uncharacterized protein N7484_002600 [Penicillium longicatenatum]|uniref:uncharacterized protein n=1 Tax=Penicillium longicatenatum TaxID=1561947 RepID=UPI002547BCA7|nr:uncharacterized protein N7484_002600 [Penicillium longicatenatum]KAJ5648877.1 hypothetical protein N7484_002600 [Penicillium longicatenatum]
MAPSRERATVVLQLVAHVLHANPTNDWSSNEPVSWVESAFRSPTYIRGSTNVEVKDDHGAVVRLKLRSRDLGPCTMSVSQLHPD